MNERNGRSAGLQRGGLSFQAWAQTVYGRVRRYLPDIGVCEEANHVTLSRGSLGVSIRPERDVWWVLFVRAGGFAMPPIYAARHDTRIAQNVADTILGFFNAALSTSTKPEPPKRAKPG